MEVHSTADAGSRLQWLALSHERLGWTNAIGGDGARVRV